MPPTFEINLTSRTTSTFPRLRTLANRLDALHADEFVHLYDRWRDTDTGEPSVERRGWFGGAVVFVWWYVRFVAVTVGRAVWGVVFYADSFTDRLALLALSARLLIAATLFLPWRLLASVPFVVRTVEWASRRVYGGVGVVRCSYPTIFKSLKEDNVSVIREEMCRGVDIQALDATSQERVFNLDIAKLLLQCSALMYSRPSDSTRQTLHALKQALDEQSSDPSMAMTMEHLDKLRSSTGTSSAPGPGARMTRAFGTHALRTVVSTFRPSSHVGRVVASVKENDEARTDSGSATDTTAPSESSAPLYSQEADTNQHRIIHLSLGHLGLSFRVVSELNTLGAACCGIFWDHRGRDNFIIIAFRGSEWTECDANWNWNWVMSEAGRWLDGFGRVHDGLMQMLFPGDMKPGSRPPFETINEAVRQVARELRRSPDAPPVNVWVTGHSHGAALASLYYARLACNPHKLGPDVVVRDGYVFGAPTVGDVRSADAFSNAMERTSWKEPKMLWRVTNAEDLVATGLPDGGDDLVRVRMGYNKFDFAHLGTEIILRPYPEYCLVRCGGASITPGKTVTICSLLATHPDATSPCCAVSPSYLLSGKELADASQCDAKQTFTTAIEDRLSSRRYRNMARQERIPLFGRVIAHGTGYYWNKIMAAGVGEAEWA